MTVQCLFPTDVQGEENRFATSICFSNMEE